MSIRIPMLISLSVFLAAPVVARSQTTDEARALAGKMLPADHGPRPVPPGTTAQTTDDARALAGRMLPLSERPTPRVIQVVGTTDEARGVTGGLHVVTPAAQHEAVASCGTSCNCGHHG